MRTLIVQLSVAAAALVPFASPDGVVNAFESDCPAGFICDSSYAPGQGKSGWQNSGPDESYCPESYTQVDGEDSWYLLSSGEKTVIDEDGNVPDPVIDVVITPSKIHLYQWASVHCELNPVKPPSTHPPGTQETILEVDYWRPLITKDSVAFQENLLAQVVDKLPEPNIDFVDSEAVHDWLYVNVGHHVRLDDLDPVSAKKYISSQWGSAYAWVQADATKLVLELPANAGAEGMADCDLDTAKSGTGCEVTFTHSSSISNDGWFEGTATVEWMVSSNSGKYDGLGPFTTSSTFRIQVAEAMAVSGSG